MLGMKLLILKIPEAWPSNTVWFALSNEKYCSDWRVLDHRKNPLISSSFSISLHVISAIFLPSPLNLTHAIIATTWPHTNLRIYSHLIMLYIWKSWTKMSESKPPVFHIGQCIKCEHFKLNQKYVFMLTVFLFHPLKQDKEKKITAKEKLYQEK